MTVKERFCVLILIPNYKLMIKFMRTNKVIIMKEKMLWPFINFSQPILYAIVWSQSEAEILYLDIGA